MAYIVRFLLEIVIFVDGQLACRKILSAFEKFCMKRAVFGDLSVRASLKLPASIIFVGQHPSGPKGLRSLVRFCTPISKR